VTLALQLKDYRLVTAEIVYHRPDHPSLVQVYVWQELDLAPAYPELTRFLDFWQRELEGKLKEVVVAGSGPLVLPELRAPGAVYRLN